MVNRVVVAGGEGEDERRDVLRHNRFQHVLDFVLGEKTRVAVIGGRRAPDHGAVLVDLRERKAMAVNDSARCVQRASGRHGVGDVPLRQHRQCIAGVRTDARFAVEQRAVKIKNNQFHCRSYPPWGSCFTVAQG